MTKRVVTSITFGSSFVYGQVTCSMPACEFLSSMSGPAHGMMMTISRRTGTSECNALVLIVKPQNCQPSTTIVTSVVIRPSAHPLPSIRC